MKEYRIVTEHGKEIKRFDTEKAAEKFWNALNGIWTDYDNDDKEYRVYIDEINVIEK